MFAVCATLGDRHICLQVGRQRFNKCSFHWLVTGRANQCKVHMLATKRSNLGSRTADASRRPMVGESSNAPGFSTLDMGYSIYLSPPPPTEINSILENKHKIILRVIKRKIYYTVSHTTIPPKGRIQSNDLPNLNPNSQWQHWRQKCGPCSHR